MNSIILNDAWILRITEEKKMDEKEKTEELNKIYTEKLELAKSNLAQLMLNYHYVFESIAGYQTDVRDLERKIFNLQV